jgi:hypothetical protein
MISLITTTKFVASRILATTFRRVTVHRTIYIKGRLPSHHQFHTAC